MLSRVLILEPQRGVLSELAAAFRKARPTIEVTAVSKLTDLSRELTESGAGCVAVLEGAAEVARLRAQHPRVPIVLTAPTGDVASAREAISSGATDFLVRGAELDERVETLVAKLSALVTLLAENRELNRAVPAPLALIGRSPAAQRVLAMIERVARVPRPVLIQGERGTGKELVARAIHNASGRPGLFLAINCAAMTESLLEVELFGYDRGAFTGAERRTKGKFELCGDGTLFLDEIGHMALAFQQKILRVVEYGTFLRVGGSEELMARTRVIAATNADLREKMAVGAFLPDLYDRLAFEVIRVPPLRERPEDIEPLAQYFMAAFAREMPEFAGKTLAREVVEILQSYAFPGNVRELKNIIERGAYRDSTQEINLEDIGPLPGPSRTTTPGSFKDRIESLERELIEDALRQSGGNQTQAARMLGLSYHQFRYYHSKHEK
jgi:DNA-binding NtrC family response regulator